MNPQGPYDLASTVLFQARAYANDKIDSRIPMSGKILDNTDAYCLTIFNAAWRRMQEELANLGHLKFMQEVIIAQLPVVTSTDPASQVYLNYQGYFDGTNFNPAPPGTWFLPAQLAQPLKVWQRWSNVNGDFCELPMAQDGMPTQLKVLDLVCWEWRNEQLYMCGSLQAEDLRIRYCQYLPDFADVSATNRWYMQIVPVIRCLEGMSRWVVWALALARSNGDPDMMDMIAGLETWAMAATKLVMNRDIRMKQRTDARRRSRSGRLERNGGFGWGQSI